MSLDKLEGIITTVELVFHELLVAEVMVGGFVFPKRIAGS